MVRRWRTVKREKEDIIEITESPSETSDVGSNDEDSSSGEEVDEGEEEDSDEDEYVDEDEPALKYERIGGFIPDLFKKDSASALAISNGKTHGEYRLLAVSIRRH